MKMKRLKNALLSGLSLLLTLGILAGCGSKNAAPTATAEEVYDAIQTAFTETYGHEAIQNMPMDVDDTMLAEQFHISPDQVESYRGVIAGMMTNCDELLVVKAKEGELQSVQEALNQALQEQYDAFSWYAVMHNTERLDAAKVVVKGNYAALLIVGVSPEDPSVEVDFSADVALAENAFNNALS